MTGAEVISVLRLVVTVLRTVRWVIAENRKRNGKLADALEFIQMELEMVTSGIQDDGEDNQGAAVQERRKLQLQELAYDIEDFIDGLWEPGASGPILLAIGLDPRPQDLESIDHFKSRIESLRRGQSGDSTATSGPSRSDSAATRPGLGRRIFRRFYNLLTKLPLPWPLDARPTPGPSQSGAPPPCYNPEDKRELLGLLSEADGWQPEQLRVISIVGCRGLGKTALAWAVYNDPDVVAKFPRRAWVEASGCNGADVLSKILVDVRAGAGGTTSANLGDILADKRYLVFIDDVQRAKVWKDIKSEFPNNGKSSRIIVTTSVRSVADACSSGSYVYTMQYLGQAKSKELFWRNVYGSKEKPAPSLVDGSKSILDKCGGLPLALISAANYLGESQGQNLTRRDCEVLGQALGDYLTGNKPAFGEMKTKLIQCYDSLPDYGHKTCLLSLSIFPRGPRMNRKSLVRRWIAEGLVDVRRDCEVYLNKEEIACQRLKELIDRSIIEPVLICNGSNKVVEKCQVHRIMLEFTIHKSVSKNFVTLIHEDKLLRNNYPTCQVRRLSVQSSPKLLCDDGLANGNGLSAVRSLTIFNTELLDFQSYFQCCKLLRVLDLESCRGLDERVLDVICTFLFLKYLSLRGSDVRRIPERIERLYNLETLDVRETRVGTLPVEVIMLPNLVCLLGKFGLPPPRKYRELVSFLSEKSKLQTLAGFVINKTEGFENIILHAKSLRKVKVWFNDTETPAPAPRAFYKRIRACVANCMKPLGSPEPNPSTLDPPQPTSELTGTLVSTLQKRFTALESLSIDSSDLSKAFLGSLKAPCAISSIKLRGELESLPQSTTLSELCNLNKLHLLSTGLSSEDLSILQYLQCLEYLKLAEDREGFSGSSFVVDRDGFPSLQRLCFEARKLPLLQIEQGAMTKLTSLEMLCQEFANGLGVTGIERLDRLNEVILHSSADDAVMEAWKRAAIQHKNRPSVKKQVKQPINDAA